jgi:hypothetical protein
MVRSVSPAACGNGLLWPVYLFTVTAVRKSGVALAFR